MRCSARGARSAGAGAASGPLVGGALTAVAGWRSVFWLVVPVGLAVVLAARRLDESRGPRASAVLPLRLFRSRAFALANAVALLHYAALFGSLFLVTHLLQAGLGAGPLDAGLRLLPMAVMPMLLAPVGGAVGRPVGHPRADGRRRGAGRGRGGRAGRGGHARCRLRRAGPAARAHGRGLGTVLRPVHRRRPRRRRAARAGPAPPASRRRCARLGAVLGVALLTRGPRRPRRSRLGHAGRRGRRRGAAGRRRGRRGGRAGRARPARPDPHRRHHHERACERINVTALPRSADRAQARECDEPSSAPPDPPTTPRSARCSSSPTAPTPPSSTPPCGAPTAPTCSTSTGTPATARCSSPWSTARSSAPWPSTPTPTDQDLGWPAGWASGRALAVHPCHRGHGVAGALLRELEQRTRESGAAVFAFHTSRFMTTARAMYERMGYQRVPRFDRELNAHYGAPAGARPWLALAYLKVVASRTRRAAVTTARRDRPAARGRRPAPGPRCPVAPGAGRPPASGGGSMPGQTQEATLVGRDAVLGDVAQFVDAVAAAPAALLLEGEPGIGKTTLWRCAQAAAVDSGHRVLAATAVEGEADLPFVGLRDLLDDVVPDAAPELPPPQRAALDAALLRSADPRAVADQHAVCVAALGVVRALAANQPLVIAVDDVGWLDRSSDRVLRYVVRRLTTERVGVLATRRPAGSTPPLGLDGPGLDGRLHHVTLGPLDRDAIHTLLTGRYGMALPRRLTRRIHAACGGNPFSAVEIGRTLLGPRRPDPRRGRPTAERHAAGHRRAHRRAAPAGAAGAGRGRGRRWGDPRPAGVRARRRRRGRPRRGRGGRAPAARRGGRAVHPPAAAVRGRGRAHRRGAAPDAPPARGAGHRPRRARRASRRGRRPARTRPSRRHWNRPPAARSPAVPRTRPPA